MDDALLFYTAVPILLGGSPRVAGRLAATLYTRHGVTLRWLGRGWHPLTAIYATSCPVRLSLDGSQDASWLRLLVDLAKEQAPKGGILCLIPGSDEAEAFLARNETRLDEHYVLLQRLLWGEDPLYGLVHNHETKTEGSI